MYLKVYNFNVQSNGLRQSQIYAESDNTMNEPLNDYQPKTMQEQNERKLSDSKAKKLKKKLKKAKKAKKKLRRGLKAERKLNAERELRYQLEAELKLAKYLLRLTAQTNVILPALPGESHDWGDTP